MELPSQFPLSHTRFLQLLATGTACLANDSRPFLTDLPIRVIMCAVFELLHTVPQGTLQSVYIDENNLE